MTTAATARDARATTTHRPARWLLCVAIVLTALNLRPAVTSLGPLLEEVRGGLHMGGAVAGLLTSLPALCFACFGTLAPILARLLGRTRVLLLAMIALTAGLGLRGLAGGSLAFLAATVCSMAGIAVSNVLLPVLVKEEFPDRVGLMTGVYSMMLSGGTALAAATAVPVERAIGGGWRPGLAVWGGVAALAILPWIGMVTTPREAPHGAAASGTLPIWRSRTAWSLGVFFGMQSTAAYATMGWLPQIFRDAGVSASTAGLLLAVTQLISVPLAMVIPTVASRLPDQRLIVIVLACFGLGGYAGLAFAPAAAPLLWAVLLGVSMATFPLALLMIGLRARTPGGVARLSSFAQSVGYALAVPGPLLVGVLYQATGGWHAPIALLTLYLVPQLVFGLRAARHRHVEDS